ncbi:DNA-processing protein DprA [Azospirillum rugosum]|uniref:DNA processing protein n=1 Tax=Azospirillum rugosum TaxID=416170 RepID=A0ABS4SFA2_9PROT|nr:DNA-processing protein DprA [Azospirillum rugosum]MBP2290869.1 DNA processing protein [Azospirillum rugosum]MDQ0529736.1 DNA processing protein [Azospirillum rugosum]
MTQPRRTLTDAERFDWLRLIRTENVGPITFHRLLERYGTARAALEALPDLAKRGGRAKPLRIAAKADVERELLANERVGARLLCSCEPDYPEPMAALDDAPPVVSVLGHAHLLRRRGVAMVGARNASMNGKTFAQRLAKELGEAGLLVVSGLARGIDTAAHAGALGTGTAAVVAGGVDIVYPPENERLYRDIVQQGVVVAESPAGTTPQARHFPRRNRLISGLSLGVLVVEAALRSGSLITARMALDQGREVMAVPGSPLDPRCQGTNNLLRQGAVLVESVDDVIRALESLAPPAVRERQGDLFAAPRPAPPTESELEQARTTVLENLSPSPVAIDELVRGCQLSAPVVLTVVLELELAGRVQRQPGNQVNLI